MEGGTLELGAVDTLRAESFGEPGQRTFRLLVTARDATVGMWLEKEQLVMVGDAVEQVLGRVPTDFVFNPPASGSSRFIGEIEVHVGTLSIGFDQAAGGFTLEVGDFESPFGFTSITLIATRGQFEDLGEDITRIVAGGRPRCPLCGRPLSGGPHFCPPSNGHAHVTTPE